MQKLGTMIGASLMLVCANLPGASWMTDFTAAQAKAKAEDKLLLLDFTGSDWCGWCMKLKAEVFTQPEFEAFASQNLILVEVDFPHRKALSPAQQKANKALAEKYNVQGFPSIMLLDSAGLVLGQMGYRPGGAKPFVARLQQYAGPKLQNAKVEPTKPEEAVPPTSSRSALQWRAYGSSAQL